MHLPALKLQIDSVNFSTLEFSGKVDFLFVQRVSDDQIVAFQSDIRTPSGIEKQR
jgi:hypothetical protein